MEKTKIDQSKAMAKELQKEQQFLKALLENLSEGIVACNQEAVLTLFNRAAQEFHGLPQKPIPASQWAENYNLYLPDGKTKMKTEELPLYRALQGESVKNIEMTIVPKKGITRTLLASGEPIITPAGEKLGAVVAMRDITERKQTEAKLTEVQQHLRLFVEHAPVAVAMLDREMNYLLTSRRWLTDYDLENQEIIGRSHYEIFPEIPQRWKEIHQRCLTGEVIKCEEDQFIRADGTREWERWELHPWHKNTGEVGGIMIFTENITQRKQMELALQESERKFKAIFNQTFQFVGLLQPDGIVLEANQTALDFGGLTAENVIGIPFWKTRWWQINQETQAQLQQAIAAAAQGEFIRYEVDVLGKYNKVATIDFSAKPVRNDTGEVILVIVEGRDISPRKRAEAEILRLNRELEQRVIERTSQLNKALLREKAAKEEAQAAKADIQIYEDIVENIPIGFVVWRLTKWNEPCSLELVATNPAANKILGIALDLEIGKKITECFPLAWENNRAVLETYAEVVCTQQAKELEEVSYSDRRLPEMIFTIKAFPLPNKCVGIAFENITEKKRTLKALATSESKYRSVVNSVKEIIFQTDTRGYWKFLNPAWQEITEFSLEESLYTHFTDYIYIEDQQEIRELFQSLFEDEGELSQAEFRTLTKTGNFRWLEISAQLDLDPEGRVVGTCGTLYDITERKQTEAILQARANELAKINAILLTTTAELEKRNQELNQFAYVTSHDLKAPLRAIANLSEWIEEDIDAVLKEETRHQMNLLRGRVHRMEKLINALLEYSRVGRLKYEAETVNVAELLTETIDSLMPPPEFTIEINGEMPTLVTQRLPLQQVFTNLIGNSIKHHNRPDGLVNISVKDLGEFFEFTVEDDGPGIAPSYHDKVFVIFQTLESRDKTENTGIGLSIVKKTVETQGGSIEIDSQVEQGTTFRFTWPK